jgi:uncharacterized Zn-binding protein involved in type VI secretion
MPEISTKVDLCMGHDACRPRPFHSFSPNVIVEGFEVVRERDALIPHGCPDHPPHAAIITRGWQSVKINGAPIGYIGATVSCPSGEVATGRISVRVGDGHRIRLV